MAKNRAVVQSYMDSATWHTVTSSNVDEIAYVRDFGYLFVRFRNRSVYLYEQVPESVWTGFLNAASKGKYVHGIIRNRGADNVYPYERIQ